MAVAAGAEVHLGDWTISEDLVRRYLDAVGNPQSIGLELHLAPPLALSAWALGWMLDTLSLPPGAIHSRQELQTHRGVEFGETVQATGHLGKPARRAGLTMVTAGYRLTGADGQPVQSGRSTVLTATSNSPGESPGADRGRASTGESPGARSFDSGPEPLPSVRMTITQPGLAAYAQVSGDNNPLHLDADFAATTQFRGIIAHGMLTLAAISQMMEIHAGQAWLESGALNVRFKGAAYLGDELESYGRVSQASPRDVGTDLDCNVGVRNLRSGQDLITGSAKAALS